LAKAARPFRTLASLDAEKVTRDAVQPFLERCGFTKVEDQSRRYGIVISQSIAAFDPDGEPVKMHVRLCWRRERGDASDYSAAQLRSNLLSKGDWDGTLRRIVQRDELHGCTHTLIVQYDVEVMVAALIPRDQLMPIWQRQRKVCEDLIRSGKTGSITRNYVENGSSPTIWLRDDRTPETQMVADVLWSWPGVKDLRALAAASEGQDLDDTFDDCPASTEQLGRDIGERITQIRSGFRRDPKVRASILLRAGGLCEREGCDERRDFGGFLDVHHIFGVGFSDRLWSCVALCPNCHRDAHFAPDRDAINGQLKDYAQKAFANSSRPRDNQRELGPEYGSRNACGSINHKATA
jgi:5-methylcytosine-specific restriction protein A